MSLHQPLLDYKIKAGRTGYDHQRYGFYPNQNFPNQNHPILKYPTKINSSKITPVQKITSPKSAQICLKYIKTIILNYQKLNTTWKRFSLIFPHNIVTDFLYVWKVSQQYKKMKKFLVQVVLSPLVIHLEASKIRVSGNWPNVSLHFTLMHYALCNNNILHY